MTLFKHEKLEKKLSITAFTADIVFNVRNCDCLITTRIATPSLAFFDLRHDG